MSGCWETGGRAPVRLTPPESTTQTGASAAPVGGLSSAAQRRQTHGQLPPRGAPRGAPGPWPPGAERPAAATARDGGAPTHARLRSAAHGGGAQLLEAPADRRFAAAEEAFQRARVDAAPRGGRGALGEWEDQGQLAAEAVPEGAGHGSSEPIPTNSAAFVKCRSDFSVL
jgi:hypothetical protein